MSSLSSCPSRYLTFCRWLILLWWCVILTAVREVTAADPNGDNRRQSDILREMGALREKRRRMLHQQEPQQYPPQHQQQQDPMNDDADKELQTWKQRIDDTLLQNQNAMAELKTLYEEEVSPLFETAKRMEERRQRLVERTRALNAMIGQLNAIQLEEIAKELNQTIQEEIEHLMIRAKEADAGSTDAIVIPSAAEEVVVEDAVTLQEVEAQLDAATIWNGKMHVLRDWLWYDIIQTEIPNVKKEMLNKLVLDARQAEKERAVAAAAAAASVTTTATSEATASCVRPMEAAHMIQEAILTEPPLDHAQNGATVVMELTSPTLTPPEPATMKVPMGSVWWRRYIPQDWEEYLFPSNWEEDWDVRAMVPTWLQGTIVDGGMNSMSLLPPSAILDPTVLPGSCWPMAGTSGFVTLRLPYALDSSSVSITVDHAPSSLLMSGIDEEPDDDDDDYEPYFVSSAPKQIRVIGYPPCQTCGGMLFDVEQPMVLGSFEYEQEASRSMQTFELDGHDCQASSTGMCSAPPSSSPEGPVHGLRLEVLSNWGEEDFTCIYRIRVHGDVAM